MQKSCKTVKFECWLNEKSFEIRRIDSYVSIFQKTFLLKMRQLVFLVHAESL